MKRYRVFFLLAAAAALILTVFRFRPGRREEPVPPVAPPSAAIEADDSGATEALPPDFQARAAEEPPSPGFRPVPDLERFQEWGADEGYRVVRADEAGLTIEIEVPDYNLEEAEAGSGEYRVEIPGYLSMKEPGQPPLPALVVSVPLPGVEEVEVTASAAPTRRESGIRLGRAPSEEWIRLDLERIGIEKIVEDEERFASLPPRQQEFFRAARTHNRELISRLEDRPREVQPEEPGDWYPEQVVESSGPLWRGEEQFVNLRVTPLRYSAAGGTVESRDRVTVEVAFGAPAKALPKKTAVDYGAQFELSASPDSFRASVTKDGIQVVTYQDLADAGFDLGGDPRSLRVYHRGQEIAVHVEGEESGSWSPGDYVAFWGEGDTGFYSQTRTYWLYQTAGTGRRMETVSAPRSGRPSRQEDFLDRLHLEERNHYWAYLPMSEGEYSWFWGFAGYFNGFDVLFNTEFNLAGVSGREGTASFAARLWGFTITPHHTRVYFNGHLLGDFIWEGQVAYDFQADIPQEYFLDGDNTITIQQVPPAGENSMDYIYIKHFDLAYRRDYSSHEDSLIFSASGKGDYRISDFSGPELHLYRVTDPEAPDRLTGFSVLGGGDYTLDFRKGEDGEERYWAGTIDAASRPHLAQNTPSDLFSPREVDYLIITHPDFRAAIEPLADHRRAGGLEVEIFEIGDVYNTFGFGDFTPEAIQRFLQYGYLEWNPQTRPGYVLLVGDGNYDYQNYHGTSPPNYVPPYMFRSQFMETASDNWYACLVGDDRVPDIDIGRFAVNSAAQAETMVQKTVDYELAAGGLPWQREVLMVADNPDPAAGNFPADSDWLIANYLPSAFTAQTVYRPNLGLTATRTAILNGMNNGKLLVNYIGHGSVDTWSSPTIFSSDSIASLSNADRLHLLVTPTCLNGYWVDVTGSCLAEDMTRTAGKGSVAAISPSGQSLNTPARQLTGLLFEELLADNRPAGTALSEAKARLAGLTPWLYMLDIYVLFGDPALELK